MSTTADVTDVVHPGWFRTNPTVPLNQLPSIVTVKVLTM